MVTIIVVAAGMTSNTVRAAELKELIGEVGMAMLLNPDEAPDFVLKNLNGETVKLSDYRNKIVLLNFMATWCHWCQKEMPHLQKLHEKFRDRNFAIVVVFQDREGASAVVPFMKEYGYTFAISSGLLDPTGEVGDLYSVTGTPTTLLIDRTGKVIAWGMGYRDWFSQPSIDLIEKLLEPKTSNK
ncbi:MAG: hypothetical protein BMS9Abin25_0105 [Gammaproteobacteria bacterium]|nr:MAG: hypothetical protein BMS9Abin25_0105 [Gammaproteobacteria bacterium]